jgi:hypothetical protein
MKKPSLLVPPIVLLGIYSIMMIQIAQDATPPSWLVILGTTVFTFSLSYVMFKWLSLTAAWILCLPFLLWFYIYYNMVAVPWWFKFK